MNDDRKESSEEDCGSSQEVRSHSQPSVGCHSGKSGPCTCVHSPVVLCSEERLASEGSDGGQALNTLTEEGKNWTSRDGVDSAQLSRGSNVIILYPFVDEKYRNQEGEEENGWGHIENQSNCKDCLEKQEGEYEKSIISRAEAGKQKKERRGGQNSHLEGEVDKGKEGVRQAKVNLLSVPCESVDQSA